MARRASPRQARPSLEPASAGASDNPMAEGDASIEALVAVVRKLLGEGGCPWDRDQTLESMRPYVLEEAFEVAEAIDGGRPEAIREELGDLAFIVVFLAELTRERHGFGLTEVAEAIAEKMIRRHPWVFAGAEAGDVSTAISAWEAQKSAEKKERGKLAGVPVALPALLRAYRVGEKAGAVGYDWPNAPAVREKVTEELRELNEAAAANDRDAMERELGDVLFALASWGRKAGIDAESALRGSLDRFSARFRHAELAAQADGRSLADLDDAERDRLWHHAKAASARDDAPR